MSTWAGMTDLLPLDLHLDLSTKSDAHGVASCISSMSTTFPDEGEMSSSREPRSQLSLEELPSARSFMSLSTISLANPHILHPRACNPAMDLVALLHEYGEESKPDLKGKGKASGLSTTVVLWRLSGSKVWEAEVDGRVLGLAWSHDGGCKQDRADSRVIPIPCGTETRPVDIAGAQC